MTKEDFFQQIKALHPDWSDDQIWTNVSVQMNAQDVISAAGVDVSPTEELLRIILEKAQEWLMEVLPEIFERVAEFFIELLSTLPDWAQRGIQYIFELIRTYF